MNVRGRKMKTTSRKLKKKEKKEEYEHGKTNFCNRNIESTIEQKYKRKTKLMKKCATN
jgi:hypothetical protein